MTTEPAAFDEQMMSRCIELARQAKAKGNTAVGSLITIDGNIVAEAEEQTPAGPARFDHAEMLAVVRACKSLNCRTLPAGTLFTTAEPCFLCAYAIREARIGRVVIGSPTPHIGAATSRYPILLASDIPPWGHAPDVLCDVLRQECDALRVSSASTNP
ncbi:MAG: nucleoside deaminase [Phycisphaerales bacterium]|nr:nucleoside deaminase [Phycisphaerales bacterium]